MLVKDVSHDAINEAYILLTAYVREDGMIKSNYNKTHLKECIDFLHKILENPKNFVVNPEEETQIVFI